MKNHIEEISKLLAKNKYPDPDDIMELPSSGSDRIYFRIFFRDGGQHSILAAFNPDINENIAWNSYSTHFRNLNFRVPEIYARDNHYRYFLLEDLGNETLFNLLEKGQSNEIKKYYKLAIQQLIRFQVYGIKGLDLDVAYPVNAFNKRSVLWDLNYFKYYFIKPNNIGINEDQLEDDFQRFSDRLLEPKQEFFLYRDFQTRNIMIHNKELWFIDFQGGRKGPLQYDLVSLLYQARAKLSDDFRTELYNYYLKELEKEIPGTSAEFNQYFIYFIYFRLMQVLGAYGFRGIIQRKGHFLESVPNAIDNLHSLIENRPLSGNFKTLNNVFQKLITLKEKFLTEDLPKQLTVSIQSFSYKKNGYPVDLTDHGGGFIFDCRALPNPGRIAELRNFTGLEKPVSDYLSTKPEMDSFLGNAFKLVDQSIDNYLEREFNHVSVSFGCTGGKHRSVFASEKLKTHLNKYGNRITIKVKHLQLDD